MFIKTAGRNKTKVVIIFMDITIRKVQIQDIPEIIKMNDVLNGVGLSAYEHMNESLENNRNEIVLIALLDDKAIGFICGRLHFSICYSDGVLCEVSELFVYEEYRRTGVATKLIKQLEGEFEKYNATEIFLQTGKKNINAQMFYEKNGYVVRERIVYLKNEGNK